jgi:glycosyltransferase involved in cell wall biosynthesis
VRIVIDYRPALRQRSGVGEYIHHLATHLADGPGRDDEVVLFSSSLRHQVDPSTLRGIRVANRRVPVQLLNRMWHRLGWPPVELLVRGPFDIAHSPHPLMMPTRTAARVVTVHDLDFLSNPERTGGEVRRDYARLVRQHVHLADHVVTISAHTAGEVHQLLGVPRSNITVCRPGAPDWAPRAGIPDTGPILFVGTLEPRKNIGGLLDAYERLLAGGGDVPALLLAGRATPAAAPWLARIARAPLAGTVTHLGYVSDAERRALYERARLLVLPSFNEGFGLPVLEAMTVGVPVVAAARGAIPEVLGDAGLLVDPDDPDRIADAMHRLLTDHSLAQTAAATGIRRSCSFSWHASAVSLRAAYEHAIAMKRARLGAFQRAASR